MHDAGYYMGNSDDDDDGSSSSKGGSSKGLSGEGELELTIAQVLKAAIPNEHEKRTEWEFKRKEQDLRQQEINNKRIDDNNRHEQQMTLLKALLSATSKTGAL